MWAMRVRLEGAVQGLSARDACAWGCGGAQVSPFDIRPAASQ